MISLLGNTKKAYFTFLALIGAAGLQQAVATNFIIEDQTLDGDATTVTVPIKVSDFANVGAMQMTISWDPTVLTYNSLGDFNHSTSQTELFFFGETNFNTDFVEDGNLAALYEQLFAADVTIADDETIFSVTFDVIGGDGSSTAVSFTDVPTPRKLASFAAQNPDFVSQNGTIQIGTPVDTTAPVITLTGDASLTIEAGTTYTDAGATATDDVDGPVTVIPTGAVNVAVPGTYTLTYNATDAAGNAAVEVTRTVLVEDTTGPVITLSGELNQGGANFMDQEAGVAYVEPGATAVDSVDGPVTVTTTGLVDENTPDIYTLTYTAIDAAGNEATSLTRTVVVADTTPPNIILLGSAEMDVLFSTDFTDPGSTVSDSFENGLTATVTGEVDTSVPDTYILTYNVSDSAGNTAIEVQRTVHVVDQQGPVITLEGDATVNHEAGTVYADAGATATDNVDTTVTVDTTGAVNADVPGTYTLTYTASDSEGNEATPVTRTVVVADTTPPVIILVGDANVNQEAGVDYLDAGANVTDSFDTNVTVVGSGEVDENTPGSYTLTYNATDAAGNAAVEVARTVLVEDTTGPVITLSGELNQGGANFMDQEAGVAYVEPGATAVDSVDGPVTVTTTGLVDENTPDIYTLTYTAIDAAGNEATSLTRTVVVADTTPPNITLLGSAEMDVLFSTDFTDPGSTVSDSFENGLTATVTGEVDTSVPDTYILTYNVSDSAGNTAIEVQRTVHVVDQQGPVITLEGDATVNHEAGTVYADAGATATDNVDTTVTVDTTGAVDADVPGTYTLTYTASDSEGNEATPVTRTVEVVDTTPPVITLTGDAMVDLNEGTAYTDAGATATDDVDGPVTVIPTGAVNTAVPGSYTLTYNATDAAGNAATTVTRTVLVIDTVTFIIQDQLLAGDASVTVPIKVSSFANVGGMQFTLTWDPSVLAFSSLGDFNHSAKNSELLLFGESNFNLAEVASGKLPVLYEHPGSSDGSVEDNETIFSVTFDVVGELESSTNIIFGDDPTPRKMGSFDATAPAFLSQGGKISFGEDTVAPVITLVGPANLNHPASSPYLDDGAVVTDNSGEILGVTTSGELNVNAPGTYTLTYNAADSEGNQATPVTRTVLVVDLTSPVITLSGPLNQGGENFMDQEAGVAYEEPGATAMDTVDGPVAVITTGTVDISNLGTYILTYNAIDAADNAATPLMRTVVVKDTIKPVLTLPGGSLTTVLQNTVFDDPGATVNDSFDTGLVALAVSTVDTSTLGSYTVTYSASDNSGNEAQEVTRTVLVVDDTTPPVITLLGAPFSQHEAGTLFTDPGAEGSDNRDGNITSSIQESGNVDVQAIGVYELKYDLADAAGNEALQKIRTVQVNDSIAPEIILDGESSLEHEAGTEYKDKGSIVIDSFENGLIAEVTGSVDSSKLGTYTLTFNASDSSGNPAVAVTRTVSVVDTTPPVIVLSGEATLTLAVGDTFTDPGSSVTDSFEKGLTATVDGDVDTSKPGSYELIYSAQDSSQNDASKVLLTVHVTDQTAPVITLSGGQNQGGANFMDQEAGVKYVEPGATAKDDVDGLVTVTTTGSVDVNTTGTYILTYNATDSGGNEATPMTRTVVVKDTIKPALKLLGDAESVHIVGKKYNDPGSSANDSFEGELTANVTGIVDTGSLGTYVLRYNVSDSSNNAAEEVTRTVIVSDGLEVAQITSTSNQISENGGENKITVYLSQPALAERTIISAVATPASRVKVPASFPVVRDLEKIEFTVTGIDDSDSNGDELVSIQLKTAYRDLGEPIEMTIQDDDLEAPVAGTVSDGLISGATVFFDRNANRVLDADEPSTQTDNRGAYQLDLPASLYDSNGDDVVDSADGVIVARGGIDTATGLTLETPLLAPPSATVINPITTLVSNMIESDSSLDADNAAALVQSSLGIGGVDVLNFDMFEEAGNENPAATEVIKAAAKVQDTIVQAGSFISGASTISKAASYNLISEILVKKIKEQQPIELNDVETLESVVEEAAVKAQVVIAPESIKGAAAIISDSNQLKESAVDAADSVANAAQEISRVQGHAQSESQSDLADLGAGIQSLEALEIKYEAENLEKLVEETAVGPVSGVDERVGTFAFSSADYEVNESGEAVSQIKITREEGNLGVVDLLVTPQALTASSDEDFLSAVIAVRFEDQEITKTLSLEGVLIDDLISDAGESFTLQLGLKEQGDSPAKIGAIAEANIQIVDNDFAGTFQFKVVSNTFSEAETGEQYLVVERVGGNSGEVTLELSEESLAGGATSGVDYTYSQSSITFGDGVLQRKVSVNLIDDALLETDESFRLTLSLPTGDTSGALIGSNAATEIRIQSDEVDLPPVISSIADIQMLEDGAEVTTSFTVGDDYTPLDRLRITVSSSNTSIITGQNLTLIPTGDGGTWQLGILSLPDAFGEVSLSVRVSDGLNVSVSEFSVSIKGQNDVPVISAIPAMIDAVGKQVVIPFEINDIDHRSETLLVYFDTAQIDYIASRSMDVRGTGAERELVINPTGLANGTGFFKLIVVDGAGASSSREFTVHFGGDAPAPVVPQLGITRDGLDGLILNWEGDALLHISRDLSGVFEALPDAVSPYRLDMSGSAFFKLGLKP